MALRVEFTDEADANAESLYDWISERSPDGAERWKAAFAAAVERIAESAETFALAPEADSFHDDLREIDFKTRRGLKYRMLFVVRGQVVYVVSVRGPGQDFVTPDDIELPSA